MGVTEASGIVAHETAAQQQLLPYVPLVVIEWLRTAPRERLLELDGTLAFVDVSGFTAMSERLASRGRAGAEEVTDVMNDTFARLLTIAYDAGGGVLKFGGDALLIFFSGPEHAARGCAAAHRMRRDFREHGRVRTSAGAVTLRMHAGIHSGACHFVLAGSSHRELVVVGPAATRTVQMERVAEAGEIAVSAETAAALPKRVLGESRGEAVLLAGEPPAASRPNLGPLPALDKVDLRDFVSPPIREHVLTGAVESEHRVATVAFLGFEGTDELLAREGVDALAAAVEEVVLVAQSAAGEHGVCFLETDVDADGGRIVLVAGAPRTDGDDEERMLRTARAIVEASPQLRIRIGINRGNVLAGEIGTPVRRAYTILGGTAALAARLLAHAAPGEVLATPAVVEHSSTVFETVEVEPFRAKGKAELVAAHSVGPAVGSRERRDDRLPLVGRQRELTILGAALTPARMGYGTFVELVGDAGIGKSRIVEELQEQAVEMQVVAVACDQYEAATPYSTLRALLRGLLGEPTAATLRDRVGTAAPDLLPWLPLLAVPLDLDVGSTSEVDELAPSFRRARLNGSVSTLLGAILEGPTLLVFEDVHWMDEASSDFLRHLGEQASTRPWLTCVTRRPTGTGFVASAGVPPLPAMTIQLDPLPQDEARALVAAAGTGLLDATVDAIAARAGGNPLFLQELVGAARRDDAGAGEDAELPETVVAVVTARIDKLAPADKTLLRWASVLGASFSGELIEQVLADDPSAASDSDAWGRLAEFVERDAYAAGGFRFRHALFRDAAYEGLSFRRRRELHERVGDLYERAGAGEPELLSLHFHRAQEWERAWRYSLAAGESARAKFANAEAAEFYGRALDAGRRLPELESAAISRVWESLGDVAELAGRYTEAAAAYRSARGLRANDPTLFLKEGVIRERLSSYPDALRWYRRGLAAATALSDMGERVRHRIELSLAYAGVRLRQGELTQCVEWCDRVVEDAMGADDMAGLAHAYYLLHLAYTSLGTPERAAYRGLALPIYEELGDLLGQANVLNNLGIDAYYEGRWEDALDLYVRSRQMRERTGDVVGAATIANNIAEILSDRGRLEEAEPLFREAQAVCGAAGYRFVETLAQSNLGRVAARAGRLDEALELLESALEAFRETKAGAYVVETEARLAERDVLAGNAVSALARLDTSRMDGPAVVHSMLQRLRGWALLQTGDRTGAAAALQESASRARDASAEYELALTRDAQARLAELEGDDAEAVRLADESRIVFERLGVVFVPAVPLD